ncbi:MAG: thioredoxin [Erysipelotrichia bacterium]|nr:thioredoxin [Erysipelotrichia bacterium]NCC54480.1 thioredoxin [Erysipelotrichia bacterium]
MKNMMKELNSLEQFEEYYNSETPVVFTFSADWCPDCMFIKPFMPKLIEKYKDLTFVYIDAQKYPLLSKKLDVMGIPSFVGVKNGKEVNRFVSKLRKTEKEIDEFLATI